jgi:hypothetical protein
MKALAMILLTCTAVCAQSSSELKTKFGDPVAESFRIRPGIILTANYDSAGKVAELVISPDVPAPIKTRNATLSFDTVNAIVDELVPVSERGKAGFAGFANIGCLPEDDCYGSFSSYEKVFIYYNGGKRGQIVYATISWKKR